MVYIYFIAKGLLILGIWFLKNRITRLKRDIKTTATVIEIKHDDEKLYKPVFKFTTLNNEEIIYEHPSTNKGVWSIGQKVKVVYNEGNPNKIILLTLFNAFGVPLILLTLALLLLFIAGAYYWSQYFFNSLH